MALESSQYTVVIQRPKGQVDGALNREFFFRNFDSKEVAIEFISKLPVGLKVKSIYDFDSNGQVEEMTVGFSDGRLDLVYK